MSDFEFKFTPKNFFIDRAHIRRALKDAGQLALTKSLGAIRKIARNSMKAGKTPKGKIRKATAGKPPLYHTRALKDRIFFAYDPSRFSGVAGPVRFKKGEAPNLLEFGGTATRVSKGKSKTVHYAGNPFMFPALQKELPKMPERWRNSVSVNG